MMALNACFKGKILVSFAFAPSLDSSVWVGLCQVLKLFHTNLNQEKLH